MGQWIGWRTILGMVAWLTSSAWSAAVHAENFVCESYVPVLRISQSTGSGAGLPGMVFVGAHNAGQQWGAFLQTDGYWHNYEGGLYPPALIYYEALPPVVTVRVTLNSYDAQAALNNNSATTGAYVGWSIYVGVGVLTGEAQNKVARRRAMLNSVRANRIARGRWNAEYDSDDRFKWSLVQKDLVDNNKQRLVTVVPFVDCSPPWWGG